MKPIEIIGGAGPDTAAAIAAVVAHLLGHEEQVRAHPPGPPRQSAWVLSWRPREIPALLPSHGYDTAQWSITSGDGEDVDVAT